MFVLCNFVNVGYACFSSFTSKIFRSLFKSRWKLFRNSFIALPQINGANLLDSCKINFAKGKFHQKETFDFFKKSRKVHLFADKFARIGLYVCKKKFFVE